MPEPTPAKRTETVHDPRARLDQLLDEQRKVWRGGKRILAEVYRERQPDLLQDGAAFLDVIFNEVILRGEIGETVRIEEYEGRFPDLADEIRRQFAVDGAVFSSPASAALLSDDADVPNLPDYQILGLLGRGGMGVVYKAHQKSLRRTVALKVIRGATATSADLARFRREAEATALMDHPHIVPIFEVGEWTPSGGAQPSPYLTLKYLEIGSLARNLQERVGDLRGAANLVAKVARGVHYAHERGILHRDLKPANILLDSHGEPLVGDFGLARRIEEDTGLTNSGVIVGTPGYMAPEQARGRTTDLTTAADVHGLGAVLYELLTGQPPFRGATPLETILQRCENEAPSPRLLNPRVSLDLEAICRKCLDSEPSRRYGSAAALADDLERWLKGEVIDARPATPVLRAHKWAKRNPAVAILLVALVLSLLGGAAGTLFYAARAGQRAEEAERAEARALTLAESAQQRTIEAVFNQDRAEQATRLARRHLYTAHLALIQRAWDDRQLAVVHDLLSRQRPEVTGGDDLRGFEWHYWDRKSHNELLTLPGERDRSGSVAFTTDGRLVTAGLQGLRVWEEATGRLLNTTPLPRAVYTALDRQGQHLALLANHESEYAIELWDVPRGVRLHGHAVKPPFLRGPILSPDGRLFAYPDGDDKISLGESRTGKILHTLTLDPQTTWQGAFSPDGKQFAYSAQSRKMEPLYALTLVNTVDGKTIRSFPPGVYQALTFRRDGTHLIVASGLDRVNVFAIADGRLVSSFPISKGCGTIAASPKGDYLAVGQAVREITIVNATGHGIYGTYLAHSDYVTDLAFRPDGQRLASSAADGTVKIWEPAVREPREVVFDVPRADKPPTDPEGALPDVVFRLAFSPDGQTLAFACGDGAVHHHNVATGRRFSRVGLEGGPVHDVAFHPDGRSWAAAARTTAARFPTDQGDPRPFRGIGPNVRRVVYNRTGTLLATGAAKEVKLWDGQTGELRGTIPWEIPFPPLGLAFGTDDRLALFDGRDLAVWDVRDQRRLRLWRGQPNLWDGRDVAFHPEGRLLATAHADRTVRLWDLDSEAAPVVLSGHGHPVNAVAFSPDGRRLASVAGQSIRLWYVATHQETLMRSEGFFQYLSCVAFSPDGHRLVTGSQGRAWIWDATPR